LFGVCAGAVVDLLQVVGLPWWFMVFWCSMIYDNFFLSVLLWCRCACFCLVFFFCLRLLLFFSVLMCIGCLFCVFFVLLSFTLFIFYNIYCAWTWWELVAGGVVTWTWFELAGWHVLS
jgi:hypothetical protein